MGREDVVMTWIIDGYIPRCLQGTGLYIEQSEAGDRCSVTFSVTQEGLCCLIKQEVKIYE